MAATARDLAVRPVGPSDIPAIVELFSRAEYEEPRFLNERFIRWQYFEGVRGPGILYGAFDGGRLGGIYCLTLSQLSVLGRRGVLAYTLGSLTEPEYRRVLFRSESGLDSVFTRLAKLAFEEARRRGVWLTYGFPNEMSYPGFVRHLDFAHIGTMTFLVRPVWLEKLASLKFSLPRPLEYLTGALAQCLSAALPANVPEPSGLEVHTMTRADSQLDELQRRAELVYPVMQVRDRAYLQWRLFDHPVIDYEVLGAYRDGRLVAYLAWVVSQRLDKQRGLTARVGHIVDWLSLPDGEGEVEVLLQAALRQIRAQRAMMAIAVSTPVRHVLRAFRRCGFIAFAGRWMPRRFPCIIRTHCLGRDVTVVDEWDKWYLTFVDNDVV